MAASPLTEKQLAFVAAYIKHGNSAQAAREAGYSEASAKSAGKLLRKDPRIIAMIERAQAKVINQAVKEASLTLEQAMKEAEEAMNFAMLMKNAGAYVKAVEHRAKLSGLLIDRVDMSQNVNFRIVIGGIDDGPREVTASATVGVLNAKTTES